MEKWTPEEVRQIAELTKKIGKAIGTADPRIAAAACLAVIDLSCSLVAGGANEQITTRSTLEISRSDSCRPALESWMSGLSEDFYSGVLTALQVIYLHDQETLFREVVETMDARELVAFARRDGAHELCGLVRYGYCDRLGRFRPKPW